MKKTKAPELSGDKKKVLSLLEEWKSTLFLDQWTINIGYMHKDDEQGTLADIEAKHEYFDATVRIFPSFWSLPEDRRESTLVHELIHAVISPVASGYEDMAEGKFVSQTSFSRLNEATTQHITNIIMSLKK